MKKPITFIITQDLEEELSIAIIKTGNSKSSFIRSAIWDKIRNENRERT